MRGEYVSTNAGVVDLCAAEAARAIVLRLRPSGLRPTWHTAEP